MSTETIKIQGKTLQLTNLDKVLWPEIKISKGEMIEYYLSVAPYLLPFLKNRPLSMKRFPDGIEGEHFFEKNAPSFRPKWIKTKPVKDTAGKVVNYILVNDLATLCWVANLACIEFHIFLSAAPKIEKPDVVLFDLDPTESGTFKDILQAALLIKTVLDDLALPSFAKTTGMRGMHIQIPIKQNTTFDYVRRFVRLVGEKLADYRPGLVTMEERKAERKKFGKVFLDWTQNSNSATAVAPYSLRASQKATVACPVSWKEVKEGIEPEMFTIKNIEKRIKKMGDVWKGYERKIWLRR